jgi:hypothetical protein|tara:strand:+ start:1104 stop:1280 length:177 start_codon:yes stop_codon:yes gene_type:complete
MNEGINKKVSLRCDKHGEFYIDSNLNVENPKDKISNMCPKCLDNKNNKFKNYSPLKWV